VEELRLALEKKDIFLHKEAGGKINVHEHTDSGEEDGENVIVSTIGFVVHATADGLALGTSLFLSTKSAASSGLGILIFFAILLHDGPASIGFGSFLHHAGLRGWNSAKHILAFTLSAPLTCLISFYLLKVLNVQTEEKVLMFWVGILLLISSGTFLYVATIHIFPEVFSNKNSNNHAGHGHED
jgi:zinc transporter 9